MTPTDPPDDDLPASRTGADAADGDAGPSPADPAAATPDVAAASAHARQPGELPPETVAPPGGGSDAPGQVAPAVPHRMIDMVLQVLCDGPATTFEIATRVEAARPGAVGQREGYFVPFLFDLRRRGHVESRWVDRPEGRRRVHSLVDAGTALDDDAGVDAHAGVETPAAPSDAPLATEPGAPTLGQAAPAPRRLPSEAVRRFAESATAPLDFAPRLAGEARAEIVGHVLDGIAAREAAGLSPEHAETDAVRALGDPWKIGTDLSRAARGRRIVLFPQRMSEVLLAHAIYDAGILATILGVILFVRFAVVAAYHIPTKSMEPTLHGDRTGGDRILVLRLSPPPGRFDIQVFEGWGKERRHYVKRCVALPGEDVRLIEGDLWIDGNLVRKDGGDLDAMLLPVFDAEVERDAASRTSTDVKKRYRDHWDTDGGSAWQQWPDGDFEVTAADDARPAEMRWKDGLRDGLYDVGEAELSWGPTEVADGRLTLDVTPADDSARVEIRWSRGAERYDAVLRGDSPGVAILVDGVEVARRDDVTLPSGATTRVRFSQVDRVLRLDVDDEQVLRHDLPEPSAQRRRAPAADVAVRVFRGKVRVGPVRLERDVHWTTEYEDTERERLGPDEFFMLGDNSSNSQDSRSNGPVHRSRLVGRPLLIVWPPARFGVPR